MTHTHEELNTRSLYLRMLRRLWIVPACGILLAVVFGLLYTAYITGVSSKRDYKVTSKYYIHFAFNENTQKAYDYYNAYTWEDMIFSSPKISDYIVDSLPEGMDLAQARQHVVADEASDIRLLTVEVRMSDPALAQQVSDGIHEGLVHFGSVAEEFEQIEFLSQEGPALEVVRDRTRNAVLLGAFLGLLISFFTLLIQQTMDDNIHTPEEAQKRYGIPVLGVFAGKEDEKLPAFLRAEREMNLAPFRNDGEVLLVSAEGLEAAEEGATLLRGLQVEAEIAGDVTAEGFAKKVVSAKEGTGHIVLVLPFGKGSGVRAEHLLFELSQLGSPAEGILLTEADSHFLRRYYRVK